MSVIGNLQEQRGRLIAEARDILDSAGTEALTADQTEKYEKIEADADALRVTIEAHQRAAERGEVETRANASIAALEPTTTADVRGGTGSEEYRAAFLDFLSGRPVESRALSVGTAASGGYTVPDSWATTLTQKLEEDNFMRGISKVITTASGTFNLPTVPSSHGSATWTAEAAAHTEGDDTFAEIEFSAYAVSRLVKVSTQLMNDSGIDMEAYLMSEISRSIAAAQEAAFVDGSGSTQPRGIIYGSTVGVTAASATAITADECIELFHALKPQYRRNGVFLAKDSTVLLLRKLKDTTNQYLWQPGLQAGQPDSFMGLPLYTSSSMPAPVSGGKALCFADPQFYVIADRAGYTMQKLTELYAANSQLGFLGTARTDGSLTVAEASQVLQMA